MNILVAGYYGQHNLGDDAFERAVPLVCGVQNKYQFVFVDHLAKLADPNTLFDAVLVGCGDVVVPFFFNKTQQYLKNYTRGPIILFGAGLTWPSSVDLGHIDQFDSVFLRNTTDLRRAERRLGTQWVHYVPDVVFALETQNTEEIVTALPSAGGDTLTASTCDAGDEARNEPRDDSVYSYSNSNGSGQEVLRLNYKRPQAAFYLIQSIEVEKPDDANRQQHVINKLAACVAHVAKTHDVSLIRFNTNGRTFGDDLHISQTVARLALAMADASVHANVSTVHANVKIIVDTNEYRTLETMLKRMSEFDVNICMRFHSHVFSIIQQVPFVSLTLTRKVEMLMEETGLDKDCAVHLAFDPNTLQPTDINLTEFATRFAHVVENSASIREQLKRVYADRHNLLLSGVYGRLIQQVKRRPGRQISSSTADQERKQQVDQLVEKGSRWWRHRLGFRLDDEHARAMRGSTRELTTVRDLTAVRRYVSTVCERLTYEVTKQVQSSYLYGFVENMMQDPFRIREYIQWIVDDFNKQTSEKDDGRRFNVDYIRQQDFAGAHRSGWSFVVNHLRSLQADSGVLLDTCMDRTFHWGCDTLVHAAVLPYTQSWCGIVHHTPLQEYTDYNVVSMVRNPLFRQSMQTCRGIFVLSDSLKLWFDQALSLLGLSHTPPVEVLTHPTQVPPKEKRFSMQKFLSNRDRKIVHIGAWLRDTFALYEIGMLDNAERDLARARRSTDNSLPAVPELREKSVGYILRDHRKLRLRRAMLQGRNMNLYMPPKNLLIKDADGDCAHGGSGGAAGFELSNSKSSSSSDTNLIVSHEKTENEKSDTAHAHYETRCNNKWVDGLCKFVDDSLLPCVDIIQGLSDVEYDTLLEENIVFLHLKDASACNTLLECFVRNVPILINPLPAVVEVLGKDYPLYYNSFEEALLKSRSYELIAEAHRYISKCDKSKYRIESFIDSIHESHTYRSIAL